MREHVTDPAALFGALELHAANRARRLSLSEPAPLYPRLAAIAGEWCRQDAPGAPWHPVSRTELHQLLEVA